MSDGWSPTELLARLSQRCQQLSMAPGGVPRFSMEDIAGALAGLPYAQNSLARVKYCLDARSLPHLESEVRRHLMTKAVRNRWRGKQVYLDAMVRMVIEDTVRPGRCRTCNGAGLVGLKPCKPCRATGFREVGPTEAAERLHKGMNPDAWRKTWAARYREMMELLAEWDADIEAHLYRRLFRREAV